MLELVEDVQFLEVCSRELLPQADADVHLLKFAEKSGSWIEANIPKAWCQPHDDERTAVVKLLVCSAWFIRCSSSKKYSTWFPWLMI